MSSESRIEDLLDRWETFPGVRPTPEELCIDCPDLLPELRKRIAQLEQANSIFRRLDSNDSGLLPKIPERIAGYKIISMLGHGGMGVVYLAEQESPRREVALKVIRPSYMNSTMRRRFEIECQVLAKLEHPAIARLYEAGVAETDFGKQSYFAMELVKGLHLDEFLSFAKPSLADRIQLLHSIAEAVDHAHKNGITHRDLKPANIIIQENGTPKILDFGIARIDEGGAIPVQTLYTEMGQLVGTLPYMSPEQASGSSAEVGPTTDVYALGVIAYEMLARKRPHNLDGLPILEAIRQIVDQEPECLGQINRQCRGDVDTIVSTALQKDPTRRYQSAGQLAADLEAFLTNRPIKARSNTVIYRTQKFIKRRKYQIVLGFFAVVMLSIIGLIAIKWISETNQERKRAELAEAKTLSATSGRRSDQYNMGREILAQYSSIYQADPWAKRIRRGVQEASYKKALERLYNGNMAEAYIQCYMSYIQFQYENNGKNLSDNSDYYGVAFAYDRDMRGWELKQLAEYCQAVSELSYCPQTDITELNKLLGAKDFKKKDFVTGQSDSLSATTYDSNIRILKNRYGQKFQNLLLRLRAIHDGNKDDYVSLDDFEEIAVSENEIKFFQNYGFPTIKSHPEDITPRIAYASLLVAKKRYTWAWPLIKSIKDNGKFEGVPSDWIQQFEIDYKETESVIYKRMNAAKNSNESPR